MRKKLVTIAYPEGWTGDRQYEGWKATPVPGKARKGCTNLRMTHPPDDEPIDLDKAPLADWPINHMK